MHILQNVPVHQHLQTRSEFVIGFPESQYNGKKRKQFQLVSHIAFFQPDPMQPLAAFASFCSLSIEFLSCILEKVTVICQISSPHRGKAADMNPFVGGMTVFFGITQDIVNCHGFVVICIFFRLEFIHRPGDSSGDAVNPGIFFLQRKYRDTFHHAPEQISGSFFSDRIPGNGGHTIFHCFVV